MINVGYTAKNTIFSRNYSNKPRFGLNETDLALTQRFIDLYNKGDASFSYPHLKGKDELFKSLYNTYQTAALAKCVHVNDGDDKESTRLLDKEIGESAKSVRERMQEYIDVHPDNDKKRENAR